MSFDAVWATDEKRLALEAGSLGELLARMKIQLSPLRVGAWEWETLLQTTVDLPPALAGFPFWLGIPVDDAHQDICLNLSLPCGTRTAAQFAKGGETGGKSATAIARLLDAVASRQSSVQRLSGNRVLLHYDIDSIHPEQLQPGCFLYPVRSALPGGRQQQDFRRALEAVDQAAGWEPDAAGQGHAERAYMALNEDARLGAIGAFPERDRTLRLIAMGFTGVHDTGAFLENSGFSAGRPLVSSLISRFRKRGALNGLQIGIRIDINSSGAGPSIEMQIFSADTIHDRGGWFKDRNCWAILVDTLGDEGIAVPARLSRLVDWSSGAQLLFGRSGPLLLLKRIHHFSITIEGSRMVKVKAHLFMLLSHLPEPDPSGNPDRS
ncbi:MAG: hypothetical protein OXF74_13600 [Rhodobacteraceae bacterium]|nr:hypothetical protein [Paracoccaceae bacterium]